MKKRKHNKNNNNYGNRNTKVKIKKLAEVLDVSEDEILGYAETMGFRIYNLPPKGAKKPRYFVGIQDGNKIKRYFKRKYKLDIWIPNK